MTCLFMGFTNTRQRLATQVQFHGLSPRVPCRRAGVSLPLMKTPSAKAILTVLLKPAASGNANCQTSIQRPKRQNEPETLPVYPSSFPVRLPQRAVGDTFVH